MKKLLLILCATMLSHISSCLFADNEEAMSEIPLRRETEIRHGRSLCNHVQAFYWRLTETVQISATSDLGEITVLVTNLTTGEAYNCSFDSSVMVESFVPVDGTPGIYEIILTSEYGDVYVGSFIMD